MTASRFVTLISRPQAPFQLFCLPHAGAGSAAYTEWPKALGTDVEVNAFMPPGRERRLAEDPDVDVAAAADAIAARADRPFALFGHSLGARVGFEVVRELRRTGRALPGALFVSGCIPPDSGRDGGPFDGLSALDDDALLARVAERGAIPPEVLDKPDLLELLLPAFRADFTWLDDYVYTDEPPLPMPITAFAGDGDQAAAPDRMPGWERHTTAGFALHAFAGGHFFPQQYLDDLARLIRAGLRAVPVGATP